jgi:hypothetical protein
LNFRLHPIVRHFRRCAGCSQQNQHNGKPDAVLEGLSENSPAFQRREQIVEQPSPAGTVESKAAPGQSSLRDLTPFSLEPGIEMPGYVQMFLRNLTVPDVRAKKLAG